MELQSTITKLPSHPMHIDMSKRFPLDMLPTEVRTSLQDIRFLTRKQTLSLIHILQKKYEHETIVCNILTLLMLDLGATEAASEISYRLFKSNSTDFTTRCIFARICMERDLPPLVDIVLNPFELSTWFSEDDTCDLFSLIEFHYIGAVHFMEIGDCTRGAKHMQLLEELTQGNHPYLEILKLVANNHKECETQSRQQ